MTDTFGGVEQIRLAGLVAETRAEVYRGAGMGFGLLALVGGAVVVWVPVAATVEGWVRVPAYGVLLALGVALVELLVAVRPRLGGTEHGLPALAKLDGSKPLPVPTTDQLRWLATTALFKFRAVGRAVWWMLTALAYAAVTGVLAVAL